MECPPSGSRSSSASNAARPRLTSTATSSATRACAATWMRRATARGGSATSLPCSAAGCTCPTSTPAIRSNAPMQGTAADIIKRAMIGVADWLAAHEPRARLILQVHDELVVEVPEQGANDIGEAVARIMEAAAELRVPLRVDQGQGANWDE